MFHFISFHGPLPVVGSAALGGAFVIYGFTRRRPRRQAASGAEYAESVYADLARRGYLVDPPLVMQGSRQWALTMDLRSTRAGVRSVHTAAMNADAEQTAVLVTNMGLTRQARRLAGRLGVTVIDASATHKLGTAPKPRLPQTSLLGRRPVA